MILQLIKKDLLRHARDPVALILWAAIPLAVAILMRAAFGGGDRVPQASLVIADQDDSLVSQFLRGAFGQGPLQDLIRAEEADSARAVDLAEGGKVSAALFIPKGFGERYLAGDSPTLTLLRNPSQTILPGIVEEAIAVLADGGFYIRELFGGPITTIRDLARSSSDSARPGASSDSASPGASSDSARPGASSDNGSPGASSDSASPRDVRSVDTMSDDIAAAIQRPFQRVGPYLFPPVLAIETMADETPPTGSTSRSQPRRASFLALFFPGILTMSMLFLGQALAVDIWAEHKLGTFRRLEVSARGSSGLVLGKVITSTIILWLIFELLLLVGRYLFRIDLERIHLAALYSAVCGFGVLAGLHLVMVLARTENGGTILCSLIVMPLVFLGGSFFPFETLSPTLRAVGMATPNGQILVQIKHVVFGDPLGPSVWLTALGSVGLGALFVILAASQARRRFLGAS